MKALLSHKSLYLALVSFASYPSILIYADVEIPSDSIPAILDKKITVPLSECKPKKEQETLCDISTTDSPAFETNPTTYFSTQIDIRPESCESFYDDYLHFRRGMRVESALGTFGIFESYRETVSTFPVIDFISGSRGHVVKSKDLTSATYNKPSINGPLYDSIVKDAHEINSRIFDVISEKGYISSTANGSTTIIRKGKLREITLHIVIQAGMATEYQIEQIKKAKEEVEGVWGFKLMVIEIP